jgi:hypothetical protein
VPILEEERYRERETERRQLLQLAPCYDALSCLVQVTALMVQSFGHGGGGCSGAAVGA